MELVLNLFTKKELLIIALVIGSLVFLTLVFTIWDLLSRKKKEDKDLIDAFEENDITVNKELTDEIKLDEEVKPSSIKFEEIKEDIKVIEDEEVELLDLSEPKKKVEPVIIDISDDVEEITSPMEKAKIELLKIEEELENPKSLEDTLYDLETMEEENAIISYQELLETTKEMNIVNADSGDEPISLKEILGMYEDTKQEKVYSNDFSSSKNISPILGVQNEFESEVKNITEIQLENTANLEKLDKEIRKTNEFLTILNDLKKNLE